MIEKKENKTIDDLLFSVLWRACSINKADLYPSTIEPYIEAADYLLQKGYFKKVGGLYRLKEHED